ncbi:hypothetical protein L0337_00275 [candidate division KSB1 bacterium]|nr:hypothetical protein [candidate division KSB1 bacterium]
MAFFDRNFCPFTRKLKVALIQPPDIVAADIDQLKFKVVGRRLAAQIKRELKIFRQRHRQLFLNAAIARAGHEVEIDFDALARAPFGESNVDAHAVRGNRFPSG